MSATYSAHLLHDREDLLEPTALLINDEWPRSLSARLLTITGGVDALPCSVILTEREGGGEEAVVGHAHLMPVAGNTRAAFVESVVVARRLRGRGLGRRMMEEAELHAAKIGCVSMHLSTHDKVGFYSHLGYVGGPKVSPLRKCVANLSDEGAKSLLVGLETGSMVSTSAVTDSSTNHIDTYSTDTTTTAAIDEAPPPAVMAPPPPPPPKLLKSSQFKETETLTWMRKSLLGSSTLATHKQ